MAKTQYARQTFTSKAAVYSGRPEWPAPVFTVMLQKAGFNPLDAEEMRGLVAADIGAGTGKTTFPLADLGCTVIAVEPNPGMRAKLEEQKAAGGYDNVIITDGDAFDPKIPEAFRGKVDLFYSGNAAHWWSSRMPGNGPEQEKKAVQAWSRFASPEAKASIMYLRFAEKDPHVRALRNLMFRHFETVRGSPTEPCAEKLFRAEVFRDYFNTQSKKAPEETYGNIQFRLRDFDHFKEWLLSHSYFPNDAFAKPEVEKDFREFYDDAVRRGNGTASVTFGIRLYTGPMAGNIPANDAVAKPAELKIV